MTYRLKVVAQLGHDGPWASFDCWVASTRGLIAFASNGRVRVDPQTVRKRAGKWVANPTHKDLERLGPANLPDVKRVLTHPDTVAEFRAAGLKPPKVRFLGYAKGARVRTYLVKGYQAAIAMDYGVLNRLKPKISGDPRFNGFHSVRVAGAYDEAGEPRTALGSPFWTDQLDPLADGRRPGIAKGPQRINGRFLALETAPIAGKGRIQALVVKSAERINPDPGPVDPPTDTPCEESLASEQAENDRLRGVIRAMTAAAQDAGTSLAKVIAIGTNAANSGGVE